MKSPCCRKPATTNATVKYFDADDMELDDSDTTEDDFQVDLDVGENTIKVKVTAEDDSTTATYTVVVTRDLPELTMESVNVDEEAGPAVLTVTLTPASDETVTVMYRTVDDNAKAGEDYTVTTGTLSFAAGETEMTISVPIIDD